MDSDSENDSEPDSDYDSEPESDDECYVCYAIQRELYAAEFNAQFDITIDYDDMDSLVTDKDHAIIKHEGCYCDRDIFSDTIYDEPLKVDTYLVRGQAGELTHRFIIHELIRQGLKVTCGHKYLEGINMINKQISEHEYELLFGS